MYKNKFLRELPKALLLSLGFILFSILIITLNFKNGAEAAYASYLELPFYFKLIFNTFVPIFNDFNYLYEFIMIYFIPVIIIYTIYLARHKVRLNILLPISKMKSQILEIAFSFLPTIILISITILTILITSLACYKAFYLEIVVSYFVLLIMSFSIFLLVYLKKNKYNYLIFTLSLIYLVLMFCLNINFKNLYYFSPLNIMLETRPNFLSLLSPLILGLINIIPLVNKTSH